MEAPSSIYHVAFLSLVINDVNEHVQPFTLPHIILSCGLQAMCHGPRTRRPDQTTSTYVSSYVRHTRIHVHRHVNMSPTEPWTGQLCAVVGLRNNGSPFVWHAGEPKPVEWKPALHKFTKVFSVPSAHVAAPAVAAAPLNFDWRLRPARWAARTITSYLGTHKKALISLQIVSAGCWNTARPFNVTSTNACWDGKWI